MAIVYFRDEDMAPSGNWMPPVDVYETDGHDIVIKAMHDDADIATKAGDIGTADLFTRLVQVHQKQRWFLKEIARKER